MTNAARVVLALQVVILSVFAQRPAAQPATGRVEIDVVVSDRRGQPVPGLRKDDFEVKEDGRVVTVDSLTSFDADANDVDDGYRRFIVLVLDDSSELTMKNPMVTGLVKRAAQGFIDRIGPSNAVTVLHSSSNVVSAPMSRIDAQHAVDSLTRSGEEWQPARFFQQTLQLVSAISRQMARVQHRRKPVVLIGPADYFEAENNDRDWFGAGTAAARANVSTYVIDPTENAQTKLRPRRRVSGPLGFAGETGGYVYASSSVEGAIEQIWSEAGHYYMLGYPEPSSRATTHRIDVRVKRPGVVARSRRTR